MTIKPERPSVSERLNTIINFFPVVGKHKKGGSHAQSEEGVTDISDHAYVDEEGVVIHDPRDNGPWPPYEESSS